MEAKWYVVRTFSGHENKVKQFLDAELAENEPLRAKVKEVLVPTEKVFRFTSLFAILNFEYFFCRNKYLFNLQF